MISPFQFSFRFSFVYDFRMTRQKIIRLENRGDVLAAGAKRVCVVSAILNAPDVTKACTEFRAKLG
jgi:hypothetical protein